MKSIAIKKASGETEPFDPEKVLTSLARSGVDKVSQDEVLAALMSRLYEGISTKEIYRIVRGVLKKSKPIAACSYNLKQALFDIGTTGYPFEQFLAGILRAHGYAVQTNIIGRGTCVRHEIDVIAEKDGKRAMIEAKYHGRQGVKTDVQVSLYVYARFLDLKDQFSEVWLVTNTKTTTDASDYGACVGLKVISWGYPKKGNLQELIESTGGHPITCLVDLQRHDKEQLLLQGIVFCRELIEHDVRTLSRKTRIPFSRLEKAWLLARDLCSITTHG